jgi:hypothetical protein
MNRRAQFLTTMRFISILRTLLLITIGFFIILIIMVTPRVNERMVWELTARIHAAQVVNNPACMAYQDPQTLRVDQYVLDPSKMTDVALQTCLLRGGGLTARPSMPAQMTITEVRSNQETVLKTAAWEGETQGTARIRWDVRIHDAAGDKDAIVVFKLAR